MSEPRQYPTYTSKFPELGFYAFPGHASETRAALEGVRFAESLGIGNVMISERADYKDIGTMCGAVAAATEKMYIGTSATNANTRHPLFLASMCSSVNRLSEGRFALGLGKGIHLMQKMLGLPQITFAHEAEYIDVLRRLLSGETINGYSGLIGEYPLLSMMSHGVNEDVPFLFVGFGPKSLKNAGRMYNGAHLHTFMAPAAVERAVGLIREGEADAGREVGTSKVWTVLATICNASQETYLKDVVARLASYLQVPQYGNGIATINGWDLEEVKRFREHPTVTSVGGVIDSTATLSQLEQIEKILPEEWRSAAIGTPAECARRWVEDFEAGADGVIIHGCTPDQFEPVLAEYEKIRPSHLFEGRTNRPA